MDKNMHGYRFDFELFEPAVRSALKYECRVTESVHVLQLGLFWGNMLYFSWLLRIVFVGCSSRLSKGATILAHLGYILVAMVQNGRGVARPQFWVLVSPTTTTSSNT